MSEKRLQAIVARYPYLELPHHQLHEHVAAARAALKGNGIDAEDQLNRVEAALETEQRTLAAAFKRFDNEGTGVLKKTDMAHMSSYLGFPSTDADIEKLMKIIDTNGSGLIDFSEFCTYVGSMGGSLKLFEERRRRLLEEKGGKVDETYGDPEELRLALLAAGIDDDAQAYWRLVVNPSEFVEAAKLVTCQETALSHIRQLARRNHDDALPKVQRRILDMGFKDEDLWMTLAWIRELAPLIVHVNLDKMIPFMETDTHYRNQFETASSGGLLKPAVREKWERDLFGGAYEKARGSERCKYGVMNVMNDHRGVVKCSQYGDSYIILKDARLRCTLSPEDSANLKAERLAVLDYYAHVLHEYSDAELKETLSVATSTAAASVGDSSKVGAMKYKESQFHGEICFGRHVERLVASVRHRKAQEGKQAERIKAVCEKHGWNFSWMDEEQARIRREDLKKMEPKTWEERLALMDKGGTKVKEGFCKIGCGRPVCPGVTRAGRPFVTCCKGCVMGFGHDANCGNIDPSKMGPGLCKMGCGKPVAQGTDSKGRPLDTCCRGCVLGAGHDKTCGRVLSRPLCKNNCGRCVAPGKQASGKPWSTCCRGCATGKGHTAECEPPPPVRQGSLGIDAAAAAGAAPVAAAVVVASSGAKDGASEVAAAASRASEPPPPMLDTAEVHMAELPAEADEAKEVQCAVCTSQ